MKKLNIFLNIYIFIVVILNCYLIFTCFFEPYVYNENTTGRKISNYNNVEYVEGALNQYIAYYFDSNINSIKECTVESKRKSEEEYAQSMEYFKSKGYNKKYIKSIEKKFNGVYIINYYMNSDKEFCLNENLNKLIIKFEDSNHYFHVYYDSLSEKGE